MPALEHPDRDQDLHCAKRKHGIIKRGQLIEIHCKWCSSVNGAPTYHRWKLVGGTPLPDRVETAQNRRKQAA